MKGDALRYLTPRNSTGHVVGWRIWKIDEDGRLASWALGHDWAPEGPSENEPNRYSRAYAFKTRRQLITYFRAWIHDNDHVLGTVALWGEVTEHVRGYCAQYGHPISLEYHLSISRRIRKAAKLYDCPIENVPVWQIWKWRLGDWLSAHITFPNFPSLGLRRTVRWTDAPPDQAV